MNMNVPDHIDLAGANDEQGTWAIANHDGVWRTLTFGNLSRATNLLSWWIEDTFGVGNGKETIGYMG